MYNFYGVQSFIDQLHINAVHSQSSDFRGLTHEPHSILENCMLLNWAIAFLVIALIAGVLGFGGLAADSAWIAKILFVVFLILFIISFISHNTSV